MAGMILIALISTIPALLAWLVLRLFGFSNKTWRSVCSSLAGGLIVSGMFMWEDAEQGFCCREYKATVFTELEFYLPLAVLFALLALPMVLAADWGAKRFAIRKAENDETADPLK